MVLWVLARASASALPRGLIPFALLFSVLLALSVIDLELYILPNKITYPSILARARSSRCSPAGRPSTTTRDALPGCGHRRGRLLPSVSCAPWLFIMPQGGHGHGRREAAPSSSASGSAASTRSSCSTLIVACIIGLVVGVVLHLRPRRKSSQFPFGPWLAARQRRRHPRQRLRSSTLWSTADDAPAAGPARSFAGGGPASRFAPCCAT